MGYLLICRWDNSERREEEKRIQSRRENTKMIEGKRWKRHSDSLCGRPAFQWAALKSGCVLPSWVWGLAQCNHSDLPVSPHCCPCPPPRCLNCCHRSTGWCLFCCLLWWMQLCFQMNKARGMKLDICLPADSSGFLWSVHLPARHWMKCSRKPNAKATYTFSSRKWAV